MVIMSNLGFATLATADGPNLIGLGLVNAFDNLALGVHGTSLIAFLSSLTSPSTRRPSTRCSLRSTRYPGKFLEGMSGFVVDAIDYPAFFVYTASLSLPGLAILYWLTRRGVINTPVQTTPTGAGSGSQRA